MSLPYPTNDQQYPGANPYGNFPQGGYQQPPYPPNVGFQPQPGFQPGVQPGFPPQQGFQPGFPPQQGFQQPYYPPPQQPGGYDPSKPMNPPYMDDTDPHYAKGIGFDDKSIRVGFIRRVYSILSIQLLVTLGFVMLFVLHEPTKRWGHANPQLMLIPMIGTIALVCVMACFESARRNSPINIILLGAFTLLESWMVGFISSTYYPRTVLFAVVLTALIVIGLTIFAFQTKIDFTACGGFLCILVLLLTVGSLIAGIFFRDVPILHLIISCAGAAIFSVYIIYDTQIMMGGDHKYSISPEEYIFAALNLYIDIIQLFLYLLRILQYLNQD